MLVTVTLTSTIRYRKHRSPYANWKGIVLRGLEFDHFIEVIIVMNEEKLYSYWMIVDN